MMKKRVAGERGGVGGWSEGERGVWMEVGERRDLGRDLGAAGSRKDGAGKERKQKASGEGERQRGE